MNQFELFDAPASAKPTEKIDTLGSIYQGAFSSEFQEHFLTTLHEASKKNLQRHVLLPTNLSALYLKEAYFKKYGHYAGLQFLTFVDLAQFCLLHIEKTTNKPLFKVPCESLWLKEILDEQSILEFTQSKHTQALPSDGFYDELVSSFHKLLEEGVATWPSTNDRQNALKKAYTHYQNQVLQKQHCPSSLIFEASYKSQKLLPSFAQAIPELFVYGFSRFNHSQQQLLHHILIQSPLHVWMDDLMLQKTPHFSLCQKCSLKKIPAAGTKALKNRTFCNKHGDVYKEAKWIRQSIRGFIQEDPSCFIGIAIKDASTYAPLLYETLKEDTLLRIFDAKDPSVSASFYVRSFQSCVDYLNSPRRIEDFYKLLFDFPFKNEFYQSYGPAGEWVSILNQSLHLQSHQIHSERLLAFAQSKKPPQQKLVGLSKLLQDFLNALEKLHLQTGSWQRCFENWKQLYLNFSQPCPQTHASFEMLFSILEMDSSDVSPSWQNTSKIILKQLEHLYLRPFKFKDAQVILLPMSQCKAFRFDHLFIPGFNDHHFPQLQSKDPVFWDSQKESLNEKLGIQLVSSKIHLELEHLEFTQLCQSSNQHTLLSYALQGLKEGTEYKCSPYAQSDFNNLEAFKELSSQSTDPLSYLEFQKMNAKPHVNFQHLSHLKQIKCWGENHFEYDLWNAFDGMVQAKLPEQNFDHYADKSFSASSLQNLATCPYRYFLKHILKIKAPRELEKLEQLRALDRGLLVHEILFSFYIQKKQAGALPLKKAAQVAYLKDLQECSQAVFTKRSLEIPTRNHHLWALEQEKISHDVQRLLLHDLHQQHHQQALAFEVRFGMSSKDSLEDTQYSQDASVEIAGGKLKIHGKIDRIDASADKQQFTVIDYKTGKLQTSMSQKIKGGQNLQMPLYIMAAQDLLKQQTAFGQAKLLSFNFESEHSEVYFSGSVLEARKTEILELFEKLQSYIRSGQFIPNPGKGGLNCSYCDYKNICGDHIQIRAQRRSKSELSVAFSQLEKDHP